MSEAKLIEVAEHALECIKGRMETWDQLGVLAKEAGNRGAHISVRTGGFIIYNGKRSELVAYEKMNPDMMRRAIDRVTEA